MTTLRQKKVVDKISENIRNDKPKSKGKILKEVGYSKSVSEKPELVFGSKGIKEELKPIIAQLEEERQRAIDLMKKKISKAKYRDLTDGIDKLTKNIQLLSGGATERKEDSFNDEQINIIAERLAKKNEC